MSYVAEPYFEVAEQLLTGLTGGVARETHRFFAGGQRLPLRARRRRVPRR